MIASAKKFASHDAHRHADDIDAYEAVIREYADCKTNRRITGKIKSLDCHLEAITLMTPRQRKGFLAKVAQRIAQCDAQDARYGH